MLCSSTAKHAHMLRKQGNTPGLTAEHRQEKRGLAVALVAINTSLVTTAGKSAHVTQALPHTNLSLPKII